MEHGRESSVFSQLLQDEDVCYHWCHSHELWSGAECFQPLVSDFRLQLTYLAPTE